MLEKNIFACFCNLWFIFWRKGTSWLLRHQSFSLGQQTNKQWKKWLKKDLLLLLSEKRRRKKRRNFNLSDFFVIISIIIFWLVLLGFFVGKNHTEERERKLFWSLHLVGSSYYRRRRVEETYDKTLKNEWKMKTYSKRYYVFFKYSKARHRFRG